MLTTYTHRQLHWLRWWLVALAGLVGGHANLGRFAVGICVPAPLPATAADGADYAAAVEAFERAAAEGVPAGSPSFCCTMTPPAVEGASWQNRVALSAHVW